MSENINDLFLNWQNLIEQKSELESDLNSIETKLHNCQNAIGNNIDDGDQTVNEIFCLRIRFNDSKSFLLESIKDDASGNGSYRIQMRTDISKKLEPKPQSICTEYH